MGTLLSIYRLINAHAPGKSRRQSRLYELERVGNSLSEPLRPTHGVDRAVDCHMHLKSIAEAPEKNICIVIMKEIDQPFELTAEKCNG